MSAGYAALHWATLNYGLSLRRPWLSVHATTPFGLVSGFLLGRTWTLSFTETGRLTGFGELVWVFTVPATLWLLGVHFRWWARAKARYWSDGDERIEHIVRMLVCWYVGIAAAVKVRVRCREGHIAVTAPVDAVDARRIEDIVMTRFPSRFTVGVQTTLPADVYWAVYRSELRPFGIRLAAHTPARGCAGALCGRPRHSRRRDHRIRLLARSGPGAGHRTRGSEGILRRHGSLVPRTARRRGEAWRKKRSGLPCGTRSASFKPLRRTLRNSLVQLENEAVVTDYKELAVGRVFDRPYGVTAGQGAKQLARLRVPTAAGFGRYRRWPRPGRRARRRWPKRSSSYPKVAGLALRSPDPRRLPAGLCLRCTTLTVRRKGHHVRPVGVALEHVDGAAIGGVPDADRRVLTGARDQLAVRREYSREARPVWPSSVRIGAPVCASHTRTVPSLPAVTNILPSGEKLTERM